MAVEVCQKFNRSILSHEYITYSSQKSAFARIFTSEAAAECPCISRFRTRYTYKYAAFFHPDLQMQSDAKTHLVPRLKHIVITAFHWKISLRIFTLISLKKLYLEHLPRENSMPPQIHIFINSKFKYNVKILAFCLYFHSW